MPGTPEHRYRIITGRMPVSEVLERARAHGVSLTEYLGALYLFSLMQIRERHERGGERVGPSVVRLEVPVDMRRFFPSKTMRNFALFVSPEIDVSLGGYSFAEVVQTGPPQPGRCRSTPASSAARSAATCGPSATP